MITSGVGLATLFLFHGRLSYVGMTTVGYNEHRSLSGAPLWEINTKEHLKVMREAEKFRVDYLSFNMKDGSSKHKGGDYTRG
jgi:hypothetical protein